MAVNLTHHANSIRRLRIRQRQRRRLIPAWGIAPGIRSYRNGALKARLTVYADKVRNGEAAIASPRGRVRSPEMYAPLV